MSGFFYHHDQSYASSPHNYNNSVHVPSPLQQDDTALWPHSNECFQDFPFHHFQLKEANDALLSPILDAAAAAAKHDGEVPSSAVVCGLLSASYIADPNAEMGVTQMPKRRKKINSKQIAPKQNDEKKMKSSKKEKEQGAGTPPVKEYIHVRARRGQATDSHSLAERVRREKIGERMKLLQSLVPGCDKIAGKAQILDEIINYVQSLQTQVQVLVGKMAILSPYMSDTEANLLIGTGLPASTESICRLEASLSSSMMMMVESSCNLLHFADDSHHNSLVSASPASSSLTSQRDQRNFISQGRLCEMDVQGHFVSIDQYWLDHLAQVDL